MHQARSKGILENKNENFGDRFRAVSKPGNNGYTINGDWWNYHNKISFSKILLRISKVKILYLNDVYQEWHLIKFTMQFKLKIFLW